jgi:FkbM family methyltransferase
VKTAVKLRFAALLYHSLRRIRGLLHASDLVQVRRRGLNWELDLKEGIDLAIFAFGSFERQTGRTIERLVKPGATVLDIGANVGAHTLNLGRLVGPTGKVFAFEPTFYAFHKLKRNLELNPGIAIRVVAEQARLTCEKKLDCEVQIYSSWKVVGKDPRHPKHRGIAHSMDGASVITLDGYFQNVNIPKIDFVKMDVDGFETEVLTGGMQTLRRDLPTICLELAPYALEERGSSLTELLATLKGLGYYLVNVEGLHRLPDDSALLSKQIADGSGINVLAIASTET